MRSIRACAPRLPRAGLRPAHLVPPIRVDGGAQLVVPVVQPVRPAGRATDVPIRRQGPPRHVQYPLAQLAGLPFQQIGLAFGGHLAVVADPDRQQVRGSRTSTSSTARLLCEVTSTAYRRRTRRHGRLADYPGLPGTRRPHDEEHVLDAERLAECRLLVLVEFF